MIGLFQGIEVGSWYRGLGTEPFEVVALDFDNETIEIQFYDGSLAELDYDSWLELSAVPTTGPDSFEGALDMAHEDLVEYTDLSQPDDDGWAEAQQLLGQI
ncbi:MAG: DUF6763 family protein [Oceanococcaceae bacterium]